MATVNATRIGPADHGRKMSLEEFREAEEEEGYCYELARGVLEVTYVPGEPHGVDRLDAPPLDLGVRHASIPAEIFRAGGASEFRLWLPAMISGRNPDIAVVLHKTPKDPRGWRPPITGHGSGLRGERGPRA